MEYLHGQTLTAVLNRLGGPRELSLQLRLRIVCDILAGLHYAHELADYGGSPLGVVHRDVSPHNIFVTYDGQVKVMDFGVAKAEAAGQRTRPGGIAGKLAYLAPEYLRSDHGIDRRADVFSVGVMLWELLSGRRVWQGKADAEIVHLLASGRPMPDLPPDPNRPPVLAGIVARALAANPAERYATAGDLEIDLRNVMVGAADSHARTLGRVVSNAFASARSEREAMIARALIAGRAMGAPPEWGRDPGWARTIDQFLSSADELLDVTVVDERTSSANRRSRDSRCRRCRSRACGNRRLHRRRRDAAAGSVSAARLSAPPRWPRSSPWWSPRRRSAPPRRRDRPTSRLPPRRAPRSCLRPRRPAPRGRPSRRGLHRPRPRRSRRRRRSSRRTTP